MKLRGSLYCHVLYGTMRGPVRVRPGSSQATRPLQIGRVGRGGKRVLSQHTLLSLSFNIIPFTRCPTRLLQHVHRT